MRGKGEPALMPECSRDLFTDEWYRKNAGKKIQVQEKIPDPKENIEEFFRYCLPFSLNWR